MVYGSLGGMADPSSELTADSAQQHTAQSFKLTAHSSEHTAQLTAAHSSQRTALGSVHRDLTTEHQSRGYESGSDDPALIRCEIKAALVS
jgi:hypothetical protein